MKENRRPIEVDNQTQFKFVYAIHDGAESVGEIWREVQDFDVILMEEVGLNHEAKTVWENCIALATFESSTAPGAMLKEKFLAYKNRSWGFAIISMAVEFGKEFHFIDVRNDSEAFMTSEEAHVMYAESVVLFRRGMSLKALQTMEKGIEKYAHSNRLRTSTILGQINDFLKSGGKRLNGKKVAIVQGIGHEATFETFKKKFSVKPENVSYAKTNRVSSPIFLRLLKQAELHPEAKIDMDGVMKILLSDGVILPYLHAIRPDESEDVLQKLSYKIISGLSDEEILENWKIFSVPVEKREKMVERIAETASKIVNKYRSEGTAGAVASV